MSSPVPNWLAQSVGPNIRSGSAPSDGGDVGRSQNLAVLGCPVYRDEIDQQVIVDLRGFASASTAKAPTGATYILSSSNSHLPNAYVLQGIGGTSILTSGSTLVISSSNGDVQQTSGWRTVLDIDFTALPTQLLSGNTSFNIGGYVWEKACSENEGPFPLTVATTTAITGGVGLVFYPRETARFGTIGGFNYDQIGTPCIQLPLGNIPEITGSLDWNSRVRVFTEWGYADSVIHSGSNSEMGVSALCFLASYPGYVTTFPAGPDVYYGILNNSYAVGWGCMGSYWQLNNDTFPFTGSGISAGVQYSYGALDPVPSWFNLADLQVTVFEAAVTNELVMPTWVGNMTGSTWPDAAHMLMANGARSWGEGEGDRFYDNHFDYDINNLGDVTKMALTIGGFCDNNSNDYGGTKIVCRRVRMDFKP
jgi:hypothetical protein